MSYEGQFIQLSVSEGIASLIFDAKNASVNVFNRATILELRDAVEALSGIEGVRGLLVKSAKSTFIVGADINEFGEAFAGPDEQIFEWLAEANAIFNRVEDLPCPSVSLVNGTALGGGCEMALCTDYRILSTGALIGLPEIKLGICPGFAGTVRLPRLVGADNAIDIIAAGKALKADAAFAMTLGDAVVEPELLEQAGMSLLEQAIAGDFDWKARRAQKTGKLSMGMVEQMMCFTTAKGFIQSKAGRDYPAPVTAVKAIERAASMTRDDAIKVESKAFVKLAKTSVADSLIGLYHNEQLIKKKSKAYGKVAAQVNQAAVLGAGIMGGGIAYQSASKKIPIVMKDVSENAINLGLTEANKLLGKQLKRKKIDAAGMGITLGRIRPALSYGDFGNVDLVVEAVPEIESLKKSVLAEVEEATPEGAIITSNTSSISISRLAEALKNPENFCGMHFFNPVHRMPLVEVIRGEQSSEKAIATTVAYAARLGKTPIVVGDCPGFLVNRVLFPYLFGFQALVKDGVDFKRIDKIMEKFGWPMGPAYLSDVVGIDTGSKVGGVLAEGYPDRMKYDERSALDVMNEAGRYGQKNGKGFYVYTMDKKGKPKKNIDPEVPDMLAAIQTGDGENISDEDIIDRMMIPMVIELARCLEEGVVDTVNEADMALIMGIGFPPFRGGAFKYADHSGLDVICQKADQFAHLGKLYEPTEQMRKMAEAGATYYGQDTEK